MRAVTSLSRRTLIDAWLAIRDRARDLGVAVPPRGRRLLSDAEITADVQHLERAIVRSARIRGGSLWPSQTAS